MVMWSSWLRDWSLWSAVAVQILGQVHWQGNYTCISRDSIDWLIAVLFYYITFVLFMFSLQINLLRDDKRYNNYLSSGPFLPPCSYHGEVLDRHILSAKRKKMASTRDVIISTVYDRPDELKDTVLRSAPANTLKYTGPYIRQVQFLTGGLLNKPDLNWITLCLSSFLSDILSENWPTTSSGRQDCLCVYVMWLPW